MKFFWDCIYCSLHLRKKQLSIWSIHWATPRLPLLQLAPAPQQLSAPSMHWPSPRLNLLQFSPAPTAALSFFTMLNELHLQFSFFCATTFWYKPFVPHFCYKPFVSRGCVIAQILQWRWRTMSITIIIIKWQQVWIYFWHFPHPNSLPNFITIFN